MASNQFVTLGILAAMLAICMCLIQYQFGDNHQNNSSQETSLSMRLESDVDDAAKPFEGHQFTLPEIFEPPIWGTLNSGHYFGMKLSSPQSLETSLIWFQNKLNKERRLDLRHLCDQNDNLKSYFWHKHDFYNFGEQIINDTPFKLITSFVKNPDNPLDWQAKVTVSSDSNANQPYISFIQYMTTNSNQDRLDIVSSKNKILDGSEHNVNLFVAQGNTKDTGNFKFSIDLISSRDNFIYGNFFRGMYYKNSMPVSIYLHTKMLATKFNDTRIFVLPGSRDDQNIDEPNIVAYQLVVKSPATFTINFAQVSGVDIPEIDYDNILSKNIESFEEKFNETFLTEANDYDKNRIKNLSQVALSNMLGSIGFFYGKTLINAHANPNKVLPYGPIQLLTAVPSRSFFPRGFLWDEGFHNILISEWDATISNKIIESWFNIINKNGWIPREVILGIESMRRVPEEFIVQPISNANPPTMFLVIEKMLDEDSLKEGTLKAIYPRLLAWYSWFKSTQFGLKPSTYRWRGRDEFSVKMLNPKTLTSGLDDYPRASHPSKHEYHVDLRCWMALASRILSKIAKRLGDHQTEKEMSSVSSLLHDNKLLDKLHWSDEHKLYCDFGYSTEKSELVKVTKSRTQPNGEVETYHVLERHSLGNLKFDCVPEFGYVSLFPFMLKVIEFDNPNLGIILDRLEDPEELWSPCGIRSLSKMSGYYNKYNTENDKPYWRGAVWINMNYLILKSLKHYSQLSGPFSARCKDLFLKLKQNLINNILSQYEETGYLWENYDDQTCLGKGSHPFTGWTSLIILIIKELL